MTKDKNKSLSQSQKAEGAIKHNILDLKDSSRALSVRPPGKSESMNINEESELQKRELELQIEELKNTLKKAETATTLYDFSPTGFFTLTPDGTIKHLNNSAAKMLGEDPSPKTPSNIREYLSANSLATFDDFLHKVFYTGTRQTCKLTLIAKENSADPGNVYVESTATDKEHCILTAIHLDIQKETIANPAITENNREEQSDRIKAEKEIQTLKKAIEQGPSSIIITNAVGKIEFVNNKFIELTQYQPSDVIGKNPRIFNQGHLPADQYMELWETLINGRIWEGKILNRRKDRTYFWEETTISAVKNMDGSISNYILIQNDISEQQQIIQDLIQAKEKAIEGDLLKTAFLANMSHEIRTPLNSIIGFSELMTELDFDINQLSHFANIINSSGNKLLSIISDIMDLSRIEAGEIKVDKRRLSVNQLITNIQKEYLLKAIEKGLELRIHPSANESEIFIESDENKLRQILINFVGNAIKFTEQGYIEIGMEQNAGFVHIQVKDTGIGIPAHYQEQIFERFRQVESAYTKKYGGNGLGLAISKALVELLGGQVGIETEQGKGSTFYFTVPVA